jgi:hypothetical protein
MLAFSWLPIGRWVYLGFNNLSMKHSMRDRLEYFFEIVLDAISQAIEELNLTAKRILEFILMFFVLSIIYSNYLVGFMELGNRDLSFLDEALFTSLLKFSFHIGWPFLVVPFFDKEWQVIDAQRIALATFFICTLLWIHKYDLNACVGGAAVLFAPLFFSALLFHWIGTLRNREKTS